jgi:hypothetical protein
VPSDETTDLCARFMHGLGVRVVLVGRHSLIDQAILHGTFMLEAASVSLSQSWGARVLLQEVWHCVRRD